VKATLVATHCAACGATTYPRVARCPGCGAADGCRDTPLPSGGTVAEATVMTVPLPHMPAPYAVGFVRLDNGVELYCRLGRPGSASSAPPRGARVELVSGAAGEWWAEVAE
jgi:uncharacterized OB-fold protein